MFSHGFFAYLVFSGRNFVTLETCYYVMSVPFVGVVFGQTLILFIGVDRLLCTMAPKRYQEISMSVYVAVVVVICSALTAFFLVIAHYNMQKMKATLVLCTVVGALHGSPMWYYEIFSFSIVAASVLCYVFIWAYVRCGVARSGCYGATYLTGTIFANTFVHLYIGIPINIGCSCNYYVLYATSTEYRKRFKNPSGSGVGDVAGPAS